MCDYGCEECGRQSLLYLTLAGHDSRKVKCPACGSAKIQQIYSPFYAHTSKKSKEGFGFGRWQHPP